MPLEERSQRIPWNKTRLLIALIKVAVSWLPTFVRRKGEKKKHNSVRTWVCRSAYEKR